MYVFITFGNFFFKKLNYYNGVIVNSLKEVKEFYLRRVFMMGSVNRLKFLGLILSIFIFSIGIFAQDTSNSSAGLPENQNRQIPIIVEHLPDWKNVQSQAVYIRTSDELRNTLPNQPVLDLITFAGGTEAVKADYTAGKLLIVEFSTPQFSIDADNQVKQFLTVNPANGSTYFRRVGNYEVFVFDAADESAANELIDQVKYEKTVQWLGKDPHLYEKAERAYLKMTGDMFISSIISIVLGLGFAVSAGIAVGLFVFYSRKQKRASMTAFSDAGGLTRLNLDELSADISSNRLLKE